MNGSSCSSPLNPTAEKIGKTIAFSLILSVVSLGGNSLIGIIVYKTQKLRKAINFFEQNPHKSNGEAFILKIFGHDRALCYRQAKIIKNRSEFCALSSSKRPQKHWSTLTTVVQSYFYNIKEKISEEFEWKFNVDLLDFRATPDKVSLVWPFRLGKIKSWITYLGNFSQGNSLFPR